ncbi:MAG: hypothetical protein Q7U10_09445 [Thermodesulfovibrionia bacterium]|nr:hypothetical protein [Thermodesulfovibrionia bacterium]
MTKVIAYKNTDKVCFCQIKFKSRERILISIANVPEPSIKIIKLLAGIIPYKTIWEFNAGKTDGKDPYAKMISMFMDKKQSKVDHPLDAIIIKLTPCSSSYEAVSVLKEAEKAYRRG